MKIAVITGASSGIGVDFAKEILTQRPEIEKIFVIARRKERLLALKEELGDVLLQVVFHAQIEKEIGSFDFSDVCDGFLRNAFCLCTDIFGLSEDRRYKRQRS